MTDDTGPAKVPGKMTGVVVLLTAAACLLIAYFTENYLAALFLAILAIGVYLALASFFRSDVPDRFGTSESGAALLWGFLMMAIGAAGMVFAFTCNVIFTIVAAIVIIALYLVARSR